MSIDNAIALKRPESFIDDPVTDLRKRHKIRDRETGYVRFTNRNLYETYGRYKAPTTAGWTKAHALR